MTQTEDTRVIEESKKHPGMISEAEEMRGFAKDDEGFDKNSDSDEYVKDKKSIK